MTNIFPKWTNRLPLMIALGASSVLVVAVAFVTYYFSPRNTDVGFAPDQPVNYSHKLHAGLLGFDCRYCHTSVETSAHANVPPTETCMNCHTQIKQQSQWLEPVRDSFASGNPVPWIKVHMLPDFAYFDHSMHVKAGVGCVSCHGRVDQMEIVQQVEPLSMSWCIDCHLAPENHLRPTSEVTNMEYVHDPDVAKRLKQEKNINPPIHCSACHR